MALLAALVRDERTTWLCHVDALFAAENKMVQYRAARAAGLRVADLLGPLFSLSNNLRPVPT